MKKFDVTIIGAGAAGLLSASMLSEQGMKVAVLEARNRIGGRVHSYESKDFPTPIERGAEFLHGKLPMTIELLERYGIKYYPLKGEMYTIENGELVKDDQFEEGYSKMESSLLDLKTDMSVDEFLDTYLGESNYKELTASVRRFVQGYDAADTSRASALALRHEWLNQDEQYHIEGGYIRLLNAIASTCMDNHALFMFNCRITSIQWQHGSVILKTDDDRSYSCDKVIITVPAGILQLEKGDKDYINISPPFPGLKAIHNFGFGNVIKIQCGFKEEFWKANTNGTFKDGGWIFSKEKIPTWWLNSSDHSPMITGWLAGPPSGKYNHQNEILLDHAVESLAGIFKKDKNLVRSELTVHCITNWNDDPFAHGAYSYETTKSSEAKKILNEPVENTLYFAGEAYSYENAGTVEAAFSSAKAAAMKIITELKSN